MNILVSPRLPVALQCVYMLITPLGHLIWSDCDTGRTTETTSKVSPESATRAGEGKGKTGGSGEEDNGGHQTKCESWEHGACGRPTKIKAKADKVVWCYRMPAKSLLKTLCEHVGISKSLRR